MSTQSVGTARQHVPSIDRETARLISSEVNTQLSQDASLRSSGWIWIVLVMARLLFIGTWCY